MKFINNEDIKTYIVYKHTSPSNKVYIGITCRTVEERWGKEGINYKTQPFYHAIEKYGWDNIKHEILYYDLSKDEAFEKEKELIMLYNATNRNYGYNISEGGGCIRNDYTNAYVPIDMYDIDGNFLQSFESITMAKKITGINNINSCLKGKEKTGGGYVWRYTTDPFDKYLCQNLALRPVVQYDKNGNYIAEFASIAKAEKETNSSGINDCVNGRNITSGGFVWRYKGDSFDKYKTSYKSRGVPVKQYTLDGEYIKTFPSQVIASQETGANKGHISSVCKGNMISCGGYIWRYVDDDFDKYKTEIKYNCTKINQYNIDGTLIKTFNSVIEAANEYGNGVSHCLNHRAKTAYGYVWTYEGDPFVKPKYQNMYRILQYDKENNLINKYDSINDIPIPDNKNKKVYIDKIRNVMHNKSKTAYGYMWRKEEVYE